jgi:molybdate transport system substrate-binding protein
VGGYAAFWWLGDADNEDRLARVVRVAAAADLQYGLGEVFEAFQHQHPDIRIDVSYGSSGNFYGQLVNRAPFDIFLSADALYPQRLVDNGIALRDTLFVYARGQLVIWVRHESPLDLQKRGLQALLDPGVRKIAIANPQHAPYGRAAVAALENAGIYENVRDRLVYGENIAQAAQFVQTGSADVGLIAHSLALAGPLQRKGQFWLIPADRYPPITQAGVVLSWAAHQDAAREVCAFLRSAKGRAMLQHHGFETTEAK